MDFLGLRSRNYIGTSQPSPRDMDHHVGNVEHSVQNPGHYSQMWQYLCIKKNHIFIPTLISGQTDVPLEKPFLWDFDIISGHLREIYGIMNI